MSDTIHITVTAEETPIELTVSPPETYSVTMSPIAIPTQETLQEFIDSATADATTAAASALSSANAAATSATAAQDAKTASETAQEAAEAAAAYAETAIEQIIWNDITFLTFSDSPVALDATANGKLFAVDCTGGAVAITLPLISTLDLDFPFSLGIKKTDASANAITVTRAGTDTLDGGTSKTINDQNSGATFIPEDSPSPDAWQSCAFGSTPADGSITAVKIASNAVVTAKILDANVTEAKIADAAITKAKLSSSLQSSLVGLSFASDTATLTYAGSATYTLATLTNAPVGTFITFTVAATSNSPVQTTTAPTQTVSSMNSNGIQIFTRAFTAASTAGNPSIVAIQIGKNLKGIDVSPYLATAKTQPVDIQTQYVRTSSAERGFKYNYSSSTGILLIDTGTVQSTGTTSFDLVASGYGSGTSAYYVIHAEGLLP